MSTIWGSCTILKGKCIAWSWGKSLILRNSVIIFIQVSTEGNNWNRSIPNINNSNNIKRNTASKINSHTMQYPSTKRYQPNPHKIWHVMRWYHLQKRVYSITKTIRNKLRKYRKYNKFSSCKLIRNWNRKSIGLYYLLLVVQIKIKLKAKRDRERKMKIN